MKHPILSLIRTATLAIGMLAASAGLHAQSSGNPSPPDGMPFQYGRGFELFQDNCAECHGGDLKGTDQGPPLLHGYYRPGHHSDAAFFRAIAMGTPQHHWNFGDMQPVEAVDEREAAAIIEFVRWHQRESGLY
ncbi:MAG TPA: cytochrome c [Arenicellales bacterium]|nr:cytochrome c [Arenicellales bacterium]